MANNKTIPLSNDVLQYFLCPALAAPTRPAALFISLHTANPGETGAATGEIGAGLGYSRQPVTFGAPSGGGTSNTNTLTFGAATGAWGTASHFGVCKSNVRGTADLIYYAPITTPRTVGVGQSTSFAPGSIIPSEE